MMKKKVTSNKVVYILTSLNTVYGAYSTEKGARKALSKFKSTWKGISLMEKEIPQLRVNCITYYE